jgi:LuxR family maltose regulon positive regulatory protein
LQARLDDTQMDDLHAKSGVAEPATSYKTAVPRTRDHLRRAALLAQITKFHRLRPITWVVGLPGSGKTSLVARWVEERKGKTLWYRLDESDGDGAGLLDALNPGGRLPAWSPENQVDLGEFARRFFGELAGDSLTVVLDDLHRVPDDAPVLAMLDAIHDVCGADLRIIAMSRRDPPPSLARGAVGGWLGLIDDLRLSTREMKAIAEAVGGRTVTREELDTADGWLAHVLALARGSQRSVDRTQVGDFLALELLASLPEERRAGLRRLAELPEIPDVTGSTWLPPDTARLLTTLAAQRYFVDHGARFRLHDLLRDALLRINLADDSADTLRGVRRDLATWVAPAMPEVAMQLRALAGDTDGALVLLDAHGGDWLARGLHRSVDGWLRDLPAPEGVRARASFTLWRALTTVPLEPEASRPMFSEARRLSVQCGEVRGAYTAWCGEVSSYVIQWGAVQGLAELVDELENLHAQLGPEPEDLLLRTSADALTALMYGRAEDPRIAHFADATARAVTHAPDAGARISAAAQLLIYRLWWAGDFPGGRALYDAFDAEVSEGEHLAALPRLLWWSCASILDWQCGSADECYAKVERGLALAASSGVQVRDFFLLTQGIFCALS